MKEKCSAFSPSLKRLAYQYMSVATLPLVTIAQESGVLMRVKGRAKVGRGRGGRKGEQMSYLEVFSGQSKCLSREQIWEIRGFEFHLR